MAVSNSANGGSTRFELVIQVVSTSDTSYTLRAVIYLLSHNVIDSNNNLTVSGGGWWRTGTLALNGVYGGIPVWSQDVVVARATGSDTTVSVTASWSGVEYWGVTLSATESYTVPARVSPPSAPNTPTASNITRNSVDLWWNIPATHGSPITGYQVQVANSSGFGSGTVLVNKTVTSAGKFTGLPFNTTLYARVRALSGAGPSGWSGTRTFKTSPIEPSTPATPTVTDVDQDSGVVHWTAPANNGSALDGYQLQVATASSFTNATTHTGGVWRTNHTVSNLQPNTTYYVRLRVKNGVGWSGWSGSRSFATLPGLRAMTSGGWVNVQELRAWVGGQWVPAELRKFVNNAWRL